MEFNFEPIVLGITIVLYIVMLVVIWVFNVGMITWTIPIGQKIAMSILMLPITYFIVNGMAGQ